MTTKDPDSVLDWPVDWSAWLNGDTIATATATVEDPPDAGLVIDSDPHTATTHTIWLSGGTIGATYTVQSHVTTVGGRTEDETFTVTIVEDAPDGWPFRPGPCTPWATTAALLASPRVAGLVPPPSVGQLVEALEVASWVLYERTGRRWSGGCATTVTIDRRGRGDWLCADQIRYGAALGLGYPYVRSVSAVHEDGVLLNPAAYEVWDYRWLVRADGTTWVTFPVLVTLAHGLDPPAAGRRATIALAAELLVAGAGGACQLPARVTSLARQGITANFTETADVLTAGRFGVFDADLFVETANAPVRRPPRVLSDDMRRPIRRIP